jgi:hypothetical protein
MAMQPSRAPDGPQGISVVRYKEEGEWVDLHQHLPNLPTSFFHDAWDLVADLIWEAAQQRRLTMTVADYDTYIYLTVAWFHHGGLCAGLYHRDEWTVGLLKTCVNRVMDHGDEAGPMLWSIVTNRCGSPLRAAPPPCAPPLPPEIDVAVRAHVLTTWWLLAARKNIPLSIAKYEGKVDGIVDALRMHRTAQKLLDGDPKTTALLESWINFDLDSRAIKHAVHASARAQGIRENDFDWQVLSLWINEAGDRLLDRRRDTGEAYRRPDLDAGMAIVFAEFGIPAVNLRGWVKT